MHSEGNQPGTDQDGESVDVASISKDWGEAATNIALEVASLLVNKQHDYGKGNILAFGEHGVLVRAYDKVERLRTLYGRDELPKNESIDDSWRDLVGYGIIALMLRTNTFQLELAEPGDSNE